VDVGLVDERDVREPHGHRGLQSQTVAERPPGACPFPYSGLGKVCIQMPLQRSRDMPKFPKFVAAPCDATGTPGAITAIQ